MSEEEKGCPCVEASEENCEECQDLPRRTLAYWRKLEKNAEKVLLE